jgi:hypothetical protein
MSINKPGALGQVNVFLACVEVYTHARFSRGTAQVLARIDCDRGYNPRHVPVIPLDYYNDGVEVWIISRIGHFLQGDRWCK